MVDQPEYGTNTSYYTDIIEFWPNLNSTNFEKIARFYMKDGFSAKQIALKTGMSKSCIVETLNSHGIKTGSKGRLTNPANYRHHNPPYGYRVVDGKLVVNKSELKICRSVVELIARQHWTTSAVAQELMRRRYKNRKGTMSWDHKIVGSIFNRWNKNL